MHQNFIIIVYLIHNHLRQFISSPSFRRYVLPYHGYEELLNRKKLQTANLGYLEIEPITGISDVVPRKPSQKKGFMGNDSTHHREVFGIVWLRSRSYSSR